MSKFSKKLDDARLKFFSGGKNAGKKMKHNAAGDLDDEKLTDMNSLPLIPVSSQSMQTYQQQMANLIAAQNSFGGFSQSLGGQQNIFRQSISNVNINSNYVNPNTHIRNGGSVIVNSGTWTWFGGISSNVVFIGDDIKHYDADPNISNTFGWRCWNWLVLDEELKSPIRSAVWYDAELRCEIWDESEVIRGKAGIHARIVPTEWQKEFCPEGSSSVNSFDALQTSYSINDDICVVIQYYQIDGIVERFGKYVLGTEGWRSEWVIIRELRAPNTEIGLALEKKFPSVIIHYPEVKI